MRKTGKRYPIELPLLLLLAVALCLGTGLERQQQAISGKILRLHVSANSDSETDQAVKLEVRDAILERTGELLSGAENREEAAALLRQSLPMLERTANEALLAAGTDQTARVTLEREWFDLRRYETFSLPGGYYDALRVRIGAGTGHNWWCVVYPQICTAATAGDREAVAVMGGLSQEELRILEGSGPEYVLKFRSMELLEQFLGWVRRRGSDDKSAVS